MPAFSIKSELIQCYIDNGYYKEAGSYAENGNQIEATLQELSKKRDECLKQAQSVTKK